MPLQESTEGGQSSEPKMGASGSGGSGGGLSAPTTPSSSSTSSSSFKPGGAAASYASLPSKPVLKLDPLSTSSVSKPAATDSSVSVGERSPIRRPLSPMESLLGSTRRVGDGGTRSTTYLTSSDLLRGPKPYQS